MWNVQYYYYTWIYNAHKFSKWYWIRDTGSHLGGQHGKGVDGLFEKVSLQTAFEGIESGWKSDIKRKSIPIDVVSPLLLNASLLLVLTTDYSDLSVQVTELIDNSKWWTESFERHGFKTEKDWRSSAATRK